MLIHLYKQATTTPKVRAAIHASAVPASVLAARFGMTGRGVCKCKHRSPVHDRSHTPHRQQSETDQKTIRGTVSPANGMVARCAGEITRRTEVVGIFPNDEAVVRLVGALLLERNDDWVVQRARDMTLKTTVPVGDDPAVSRL